jgi:outer membrane protein OmpA-like peptidoglycan-associated protein
VIVFPAASESIDDRALSGTPFAADTVEPAKRERSAVSSLSTQGPPTETGPSVTAATGNTITLDQIHENFGEYPEISFAFDANTFGPEAYDMLEMIARYCLQHPGAALVLRGYTDTTGVRAYNLKLSEFRADMVKTYLVGKGVKSEAITTLGIGPGTDGPGNTAISREGNRRKVIVEMVPPNESGVDSTR